MTLSSNLPNPVRPIGSNVTLKCSVHIPAVDIPLTLETVLTGPDEFMTTMNISQPILGTISMTHTMASRVVISSFGREQSGSYTCTANLHLSSLSTNHYLISSAEFDSMQVVIGETVAAIIFIASLANLLITHSNQVTTFQHSHLISNHSIAVPYNYVHS